MRTVLLFLFVCPVILSSAQDRSALESKREKLLGEIRYTERLLSKTRKDVQATASDISAMDRKIELREALIDNLEQEVYAINRDVRKNESVLEDLKRQHEKLKANYARSVYNSYKYQKANQQLVFILGAKSFNQAFRRLNYLRKINQRRKEQGDEIKARSDEIRKTLASLEKMKQEKTSLLAENTVQMNSLREEKALKDQFVARLKRDEKKYRADIDNKSKEAERLQAEIREIIRRELAAKENTTSSGLERTPEALARLSEDFVSNKGKLPWPVERGYISRSFGKQRHPQLSNIEIDNNGIDIRTGPDSPVRTVFKGDVVSVFTNPIFKHAVIVKHGEYFSVYTKLGRVKVKAGDQLDTGDIVGYAYSENDVAEVHLEIWKGKTNLDPYSWIARR